MKKTGFLLITLIVLAVLSGCTLNQSNVPALAPTPSWTYYPPESEIQVPILVYHHVDYEDVSDRYNIYPNDFAEHMSILAFYGYTTITVSDLVTVIREGGQLPPRPIILTFDDSNLSVYENAYPIMRTHGFIGVTYAVANRLESQNYINSAQLKELIVAGWEVGSHSMTHADLSQDRTIVNEELRQSKQVLEEELGITIETFAYPFTHFKEYVGSRVPVYGYSSAVGVGDDAFHSINSVYYLFRQEVSGSYNLLEFIDLLPWKGEPE